MSAAPGGPSAAETVTAEVALNVAGHRLQAKVTVPKGPMRPVDLLPIARSLTDAFVGIAVEEAQEAGERVSCGPGCGACCRQLVPISEPEARAIAGLVEGLPDPRRSQVEARFQQVRDRLQQAGLLEKLLEPEGLAVEDLRPLGLEYFRLGIPCPFLEAESCSIHPERPLACREYLVTSPPAACACPSPETVRCVEMSGKVSVALRRVSPGTSSGRARWIPLSLAPDWVRNHPSEPPPRPGPEQVEALIRCLASPPAPDDSAL